LHARLRRAERDRRRLLRQLLTAQEDERRRLTGYLHDDAVQSLAAALLHLDVLEARLERAGVATSRRWPTWPSTPHRPMGGGGAGVSSPADGAPTASPPAAAQPAAGLAQGATGPRAGAAALHGPAGPVEQPGDQGHGNGHEQPAAEPAGQERQHRALLMGILACP
jgi:hypothetical protein